MTFQAKVIACSISEQGKIITTMQLSYPRFIHAEFMTHRVFSRNASSSRAIPVAKMLEQVRTNPAMPIHWGKNQPGMQANEQHNAKVNVGWTPEDWVSVQDAWRVAAAQAADIAERFMQAGYHKQVVNRILEPFQWIHVVVTATEWWNFFELRDHPDAQPEIRHLAQLMKQAMGASTPVLLKSGEWHLPYVTVEDREATFGSEITRETAWELLRKVSAARCCRVSYLKHDGEKASIQEELDLCHRLAGARPIHASPFEHQATPDTASPLPFFDWSHGDLHGNLVGWIQHRKILEQQIAAGV